MHGAVERTRRHQLIEAAAALFQANGYRAVTMEAVAAEAQVAKATLYSYFPNKEALFSAVAVDVTNRIADALHRELESERPLDERLARALIARHTLVFELVERSPHARELMYAKEVIAQAPVLRTDAEMIGALETALREDRVLAKQAKAIATTLFFGAIGVSHHSKSAQQIEDDIGGFVRPYLAGARLLAQSGATKQAGRTKGR